MPAYWLARAKVLDPVAYKEYTDRIPAIMAKYGGRVLSRGAPYETLEGPDRFDRFVLIEFDTMDAVRRCFESPDYVEAAAFRRHGAGENEFTIIDGGEHTA